MKPAGLQLEWAVTDLAPCPSRGRCGQAWCLPRVAPEPKPTAGYRDGACSARRPRPWPPKRDPPARSTFRAAEPGSGKGCAPPAVAPRSADPKASGRFGPERPSLLLRGMPSDAPAPWVHHPPHVGRGSSAAVSVRPSASPLVRAAASLQPRRHDHEALGRRSGAKAQGRPSSGSGAHRCGHVNIWPSERADAAYRCGA